jgi:hypothetical protein
MKKLIVPLVAVSVVLSGCLVTSVCPFYTDKDLTFDKALVGSWTNAKEAGEQWKFEKHGENAYQVTYTSNDKKTSNIQAHLFKIGAQTFLDFLGQDIRDDVQPPPIPAHMLLRVDQLSPSVKLTPLDYEWLTKWLDRNPKDLRHHIIRTGDNPDDTRLVLTADTAELQQFIVKHLKTEDAWKDGVELNRDSTAASRE